MMRYRDIKDLIAETKAVKSKADGTLKILKIYQKGGGTPATTKVLATAVDRLHAAEFAFGVTYNLAKIKMEAAE
jgi:hypothetical protein